ncbi:MAG: glycosyltransferase family 1 protein [Bacteroidales bacterium]|nr:glycosyltransferase family 1 protein [Bacteroidales bacterium]
MKNGKITKKLKKKPLIGLAGNINYVIDIQLLIFIVKSLPQYDFELAGKIELNEKEMEEFNILINLKNVTHIGFIKYDEFPKVVVNWDIGLVAAKLNMNTPSI